MSESRVAKEIYLDTENNQIRSYKNSTFYALSPDMTLFRGSQVLFQCHLMLADAATYFTPPAGGTWLFGIDDQFTADHADLVVSDDDQFNLDGDWDLLAETSGRICWRVDLTTNELKDSLGDTDRKAMYACLWFTPSGGDPTLMAQWNVTMKNIAVDPTTAIPSPGITFDTVDRADSTYQKMKTDGGELWFKDGKLLYQWCAGTGKYHRRSLDYKDGVVIDVIDQEGEDMT
jgi:hypothetical protein